MTVFDPGLQPERTRLAWRRTLLSAAVVALVALRTPGAGAVPAVVAVPALLAIAATAVAVRRRARAVDRALADRAPLPGGGLAAVLAATVTVPGAVVALAVLLG